MDQKGALNAAADVYLDGIAWSGNNTTFEALAMGLDQDDVVIRRRLKQKVEFLSQDLMVPPDPTSLSRKDLRGLLRLGRHFRDLGEADFFMLYKLMTMSSADFLDEWFETDPLKATMSASGIIGTFLGPRSPGTAYVQLHHYMGEIDGAFRAWGFARGGTGAVAESIASAARELGVTIRENTERPITITEGTNTLAGADPERVEAAARGALNGEAVKGRVPDLWDGKTAPRIVDVFEEWWRSRT